MPTAQRHVGQKGTGWLVPVAAVLVGSGILRPRRSGPLAQPLVDHGNRAGGERDSPSQRNSESRRPLGRGRDVASPLEMPPRGWKDVVLRIYRSISDDRLLAISAGVTFYILLAIFPAIAAFVSLYGLFADPSTIAEHLNSLSNILPEGGVQIIGEQIKSLTSQPAQQLGLATLISLAIALWSSNGGVKAIFDALNVVYQEKEKRGFFSLNAISLAFTVGPIVFLLLAIAALAVLPALLDKFGLSRIVELVLMIGRWPLLLVLVSLGIALIYRFDPSRDKARWRWITPGSIFSAIAWLAASFLFSWYVQNFGSYNKTYGSLGAAVGFMTWVWLSIIVILLGAKLNAEMEHQTARDTTVGSPRRIGERGAQMADTLGPKPIIDATSPETDTRDESPGRTRRPPSTRNPSQGPRVGKHPPMLQLAHQCRDPSVGRRRT